MKRSALSQTTPFTPADGVEMRPLSGEGAMLNLVDLAPGSTVPLHSHPHEQLGYVIEGTLELTVDGVLHSLPAGSAYCVPGGVEHGAQQGGSPCRVLDVFAPPRDDYREHEVDG